jgi:hypothetical protein
MSASGAVASWVSVQVQLLGSVATVCVGMFIVLRAGHITDTEAGVMLVYVCDLPHLMQWTVYVEAVLELSMCAVERAEEFWYGLTAEPPVQLRIVRPFTRVRGCGSDAPQEAAAIVPDRRPPADWPPAGEIDVKDLRLRYRSSPEVGPVPLREPKPDGHRTVLTLAVPSYACSTSCGT